jgi:hypothetical protein
MKKTSRIGVLAGAAIAVLVAGLLVNFSKDDLAQSLNSILQGNDSGAGTLYRYWQLKNAPEPGQYEDKLVGGKMLFQCKVGETYPAYFGYLVIKETFSLGFPTPGSKPYTVYLSAIDYGDHSSISTGPQEEQGAGPLSELRARGCEVPSGIANAAPPVVNSDSAPASSSTDQNSLNELPSNAVKTRFGVFQVQVGEKERLQGKLYADATMLTPNDGISEVTIKSKFEAGDADLLLVEQTHGTSCLATYTFFTVTANAVSASSEFGTCAEASEIKPNGSTIRISMPGFKGPFESPESQAAAAKERHVFVYHNGAITEPRSDTATSSNESPVAAFSIVGAWSCGDSTMAFFPDGTTLTYIHKADGEPRIYVAGNYRYGANILISHLRASKFEVRHDVPRQLSQWTPSVRNQNVLESNDIYMKDQIGKADDASISIKEVRVMNWDQKTIHDDVEPEAQVCKPSQTEYDSLLATKSSIPYEYLQPEDLPEDF